MKKMLFFLSCVFNIVLIVLCTYFYTKYSLQATTLVQSGYQKELISAQKVSSKKHKIAGIIPATHKALDEIVHGFERSLVKDYHLSFFLKIYNANGNRSLLRAQIEDVATSAYDLVVTIGAGPSQLTKEIFTKRCCKTPIVFAGVKDPVVLGLVESFDAKNKITGSAAVTDYALQVDLLLMIKPAIKNVLLLYDPTQGSGLESDRQEIEGLFTEKNITFKAAQVFNITEIQQKIPSLISKDIDLVMILKDNTVVPAIDLIIKHCERHGVTAFATDLDSSKKGVALAFGVHESQFGIDAAACAYKILHEGLSSQEVPVKLTKKFRFAINRRKLQAQGVHLEKRFSQLLALTEFVKESPLAKN